MSTWILLRGLTRESRHWGAFPETFRREIGAAADVDVDVDVDGVGVGVGGEGEGEGDRIALLDLPGNGRERALRAPLSVAEMMAFVRSRAVDLGIPLPYRLLAMSLGGMVATEWAQRYPREIERLVLINTSMRPFCGITQRLRPAAWPAMGRVVACWGHPQESERIVHGLTCNRSDSVADDIAAWAEIRGTAPVSAANGRRQLWAAARFRADREAPCCPTLLLSSAADRLVAPGCSARIAAQWRAAHVEHPWAGHDLPHDDPRWTSKTIGAWLLTVEAQTPGAHQ